MLHENWALMPWVDSNYCRPCFQGSNQPRRPGGFILIFVSKYEMIIQTDSKGGGRESYLGTEGFCWLGKLCRACLPHGKLKQVNRLQVSVSPDLKP